MSVSIYNKTDNKLSSLANQTELMSNDGTADITSQIENLATSVKRKSWQYFRIRSWYRTENKRNY